MGTSSLIWVPRREKHAYVYIHTYMYTFVEGGGSEERARKEEREGGRKEGKKKRKGGPF